MYRPDDLERLVVFRNGCADESLFICRTLSLRVTGAGVPCGGDDKLIVLDGLILDADPVSESSAWCFGQTYSLAFRGPLCGVPFHTGVCCQVAGLNVVDKLRIELTGPSR